MGRASINAMKVEDIIQHGDPAKNDIPKKENKKAPQKASREKSNNESNHNSGWF